MNTRQKAKRYKKLYEQMLPRVRQPRVSQERPLLQYRCRVKCPKQMSMPGADHTREYAINRMIKDFKDLIDNQITYNDNEGCYEMTVWVRDKNKS